MIDSCSAVRQPLTGISFNGCFRNNVTFLQDYLLNSACKYTWGVKQAVTVIVISKTAGLLWWILWQNLVMIKALKQMLAAGFKQLSGYFPKLKS